ncbi:MAG: hypothetical protein OXH68_15180 [Gammaproteobacteria bacterium]|nr:hypothetical protein [Gammaproteobacteria bacterium]
MALKGRNVRIKSFAGQGSGAAPADEVDRAYEAWRATLTDEEIIDILLSATRARMYLTVVYKGA